MPSVGSVAETCVSPNPAKPGITSSKKTDSVVVVRPVTLADLFFSPITAHLRKNDLIFEHINSAQG